MERIYLFYGEEELIIQNKINKVIKDSQADSFNITSYDMEEESISKALNDCMTLPFLNDEKVVIIKNPIFLTKEKSNITHNLKAFSNYLANPSPSAILVINAYGLQLDEKNEIVKELYKVAIVNKTSKLSRIEAEGWLKRQFTLQGYAIDDSTVRLFFDRIGENLVNAKNELDKLICYLGDRHYITDDDVKNVVIREIESDVYKLTNAIIAHDKEKTITIYEDLTKAGKNPMDLFALVSRTLNLLLVVKKMMQTGAKQADIASGLKLNPYRVKHLMDDAKKYSFEELEDNILRFASLDYKIKSGKLDSTTGIEFVLFEIK